MKDRTPGTKAKFAKGDGNADKARRDCSMVGACYLLGTHWWHKNGKSHQRSLCHWKILSEVH
eukprot:5358304-Amphidinium_carterae.2